MKSRNLKNSYSKKNLMIIKKEKIDQKKKLLYLKAINLNKK
jgi:hypothetical protein